MSESAELKLPEKTVKLPLVVGTEGERAVDISKLRADTGYITLDPGFVNTGSCQSKITFIDGENGILHYRGIPIEVLAEKSTFLETCYLLLYGNLPDATELSRFTNEITHHTMLHEDLKRMYDGFPRDAHPMAVISSVVVGLSCFYQGENDNESAEQFDLNAIRLLAKLPTIAAYAYKKTVGQPFVYPDNNRSYCENFLYMMFSLPAEEYELEPEWIKALDVLLILHADHEQNCSTSTVRMVRSSGSNIFACIAAGICALWGPLHGGANQAVIEMLEKIRQDGGNVAKYVELAKRKDSDFRLMGFGHRVYKNFDPRCKIIKKICDDVLNRLKVSDPLLDLAKELEEAALKDPYFVEKRLYPNVDFYSGIIYKAMGIPVDAFTEMFAFGRLPGWLAQAKEYSTDPTSKLNRPRQIYIGPRNGAAYKPVKER